MRFSSIHVVGVPTVQAWSSSVVYTPGNACVALAWTVPANDEAIGKSIRETLDASQSQLRSAQDFVDLIARLPSSQLAGVFCLGQESVVCAGQGASCVLVRGGQAHQVIGGETAQVAFVRGTLVPGDTLLIGTQEFFARFAAQLVSSVDLSTASEQLASTIAGESDAGATAAVVLTVAAPKAAIAASQVPPILTAESPSRPARTQVPPAAAPRRRRGESARILFVIARYRKLLALGAVVLLVIAAVIGVQRVALGRRMQRITTITAPFGQRIDDAEALTDPIEQIKAYRNLRQDLEQAKEQYKSDAAIVGELDRMLRQVIDSYTSSANEKQVDSLTVFYDFRLVASDFVASSMAYDAAGKLAVFVDGTHKRMLSIALETKQPQTLSLPQELAAPQSVAVANRKAYVLGSNGIVEMSLPLETAGRMLIKATDDWKSPTLLGVYDKYLYAVDTTRRGLFRFDTSDPTASPSSWLRDREGVNWESLSSISVDGDVWFGTQGGEILRFRRGEKESFTATGLLDAPTSRIAIFTTEESENLYLLEPRALRLTILSKTGEYRSSLTSPDLATATGLIVDDSTKTAYILAGSLIYSVQLE